jgi:Skp family chaperone for outer membrane proteins
MKLLTLVLFFGLIVAFSSTSAAAQHQAASSLAIRSPEVVLKEFYQWYIREVNGPSNNYPWKTTRGRATLKKYVTEVYSGDRQKRETARGGRRLRR